MCLCLSVIIASVCLIEPNLPMFKPTAVSTFHINIHQAIKPTTASINSELFFCFPQNYVPPITSMITVKH